MMKNICLLLALGLLSSCSTELKYHMTNHRFLTPETKGEFLKGDIGLAFQLNQDVVLAKAYDAIVFNSHSAVNMNSSIESTGEFNVPITLGLLKRLDFYTLDEKYGFKFQFIGSPENERHPGWKAAIAAAYGQEENDSANVTFTSGTSSRTYNTKIKLENNSVQLIVGNRINENVLVYVSLVRDYYKYNGSLMSSQFSTVQLDGHSVNYGGSLGVHLMGEEKRPAFIKAEAGIMEAKLDRDNNSKTAGTAGATVGWSW